jgi:gliding motility-associated-like protein
MNNFLRAQLKKYPDNSIKLLKWPYMSVVLGLMLMASLLAPVQGQAAIGFSGGVISPTAASPQLVCSGGQAVITLTPSTCFIPTGADWTGWYFVDSSSDGGTTWHTPSQGVVTGFVNAASPPIVYTSGPLISLACYTLTYRIRLDTVTQHCTPGNTSFTSLNANVLVCPIPAAITGPSSVCVTNSITLSTSSTGGVWSSSNPTVANVTAAGLVTGALAGTATISYTVAGCSSTRVVTVNANPGPILGSTTVCAGTTATYTLAPSFTGTWSSSTAAVGTIDAATGVYTASATTTGTNTITFTTSAGCTNTRIITVNPFPDTIGCYGSGRLCFGADTLTLCNASAGGTWSTSDPAVITMLNPTTGRITPAAPFLNDTTATITYTLLGCSVTRTLTVSAGPTNISGPDVMCEGTTVTLTATPASGVWSDGSGDFTVGATTGLVFANAGSGGRVGTVVYSIGSCSLTKSITINPTPTAIVGGPALCVGNTVTFTSTPAGGLWTMSFPGGPIGTPVGVLTGIFTPTTTGTAVVSYTIPSTGCRTITTVNAGVAPDTITGPTRVCQNASITLCNTTFGGDWGVIAGGTGSGTVSPTFATCTNFTGTVAGTVIVTYSLGASGCSVSKIVTVDPAPAAIAGPDYLCIGVPTNYTTTPPAGLWTVAPAGFATITPATGVATGTNAGTTIISYTLPNGCRATKQVTVATTPSPVTGILSICVGQSTTLTSAPVGGTWIGSDTAIATVTPAGPGSATVLGVSPGGVIVTYAFSPSGCNITTVVTVNPLPPVITGPTSVCQFESVTLSNSAAGGTWSSVPGAIASINPTTGVVTGNIPGTATIGYTTPTNGCTRTRVFTVNPLPLDISGPTSVCVGATINLDNFSAGGPGTWTSSNPSVANVSAGPSTSTTVTGFSAGTTRITYTLPTGCDTAITITVNPLPAAITGDPRICVGSCKPLFTTSTGGTWSSSDPTIATIHPALGTLCGINIGTAFITYTLPTGCITVTAATVDPTPASITGPSNICTGTVTTLTHPIPGGTWSSSDTNVVKIFLGTGLATGMASGTVNISYTTSIGCVIVHPMTVNPVPPASTGIQYMCVNNSTTLSNIVAGGTWVSANTGIAVVGSSTGIVTGIFAGTVDISYVLPTGCAAVTVVTVYPLPVISGSVLVCPGVASTLTAAPTGGLWTSSAPAIATIGSLSGVVTGPGPGTVTIFYTLASTCQTSTTVTIQPLPAVTTGPTQVCVNSSIQLFNFTGGGGSWSSSNPGIATVGTNGVVTGVAAGTTSITFTSSVTGCVIGHIITVNPLPTAITGPATVCAGSTVTLSSTPVGGTWSVVGGHTTVNATTGNVTGISAGVDTVTYTLPTGCLITRTITVNPLPDAINGGTTANVCFGNTITVFSGPAGGTWSWTNGSGTITLTPLSAGSDTATVTGTSWGTATITYTLPTGCLDTAIIRVDSLPSVITGALNLCVNDSTTLVSSPSGGTWTSDNIYIAVIDPSTGLLATVSAGTVLITYTLPTGCFTVREVTINPTPQPIGGPLQVCVDDTITLTNVTFGGAWMSSNPSVATIGSATGEVIGVTPGTTIVTYTLPSSCSRTAVVTVNPLPTPIIGPLAICRFDTTAPPLSSTPGGGTWSSSAPGTAFIFMPTGQMIGINAGFSTITYMLPTGCYVTAQATINPVPTASGITGPRVLCQGQISTPLGHAVPAFTGGTWSASPTTVATINATTGVWGAVLTGSTSVATATITYTLLTGCDTFITVTVNPLPAAITGVLQVCVNDSTTLSSATIGGTWSGGSAAIGTINPTTGVFHGIASGVTVVTYTAPGTSCFVTAFVTVNPLPGLITASSNICNSAADTIFSSGTGGSWTWTGSPGGIISVIPFSTGFDSARIVALDTGTVTISYTLGTGCYTTHVITVRPLPGPIVGPSAVCFRDTAMLIVTAHAGTSGTWSSAPPPSLITILPISAANDTALVVGNIPGTDTITYTNDDGCSTQFVITVNPIPTAIFGPNRVCEGFTITQIDTTLGGTWSISDTTFLTTVATISSTGVVTGIIPGTATVTYMLPTGCFVTRVITVNPVPNVVIDTHPSVICKYSSTTLTASGLTTGGTYTWAPPTGLSSAVGATVVASPTVTTTYTVTGTTLQGCSDTAVVTVWVDSLLNDLSITGEDSVCRGGCTQLIARGREGTYFEWHPSTALSCTICDTVTACPLSTTTYYALAIDSLGCRDSVFFTVTVMPLPIVSVSPTPAIVCNGSSTQLFATDLAGNSGTRYAWFPNAFISCDTCSNPFVSNTFNLVYRVTGITPFGCYDSIKVPVTVLDSAFNTINKDTVICEGASAQLYIISINPDGARSDYLWTNPGGTLSNTTIYNPVATPSVTTTYRVIVTPNVCWPDTLFTTVVVVPRPEISIDVSPRGNVAPGTAVTLTASVTNGILVDKYAWTDPSTLSCSECYKTIATPTITTTYTFTATSVYGCTNSATTTINVGCQNGQVYIANSFTPNGDGMNDRFYVQGKGISKVTKFLIFGRWGEMVYEKYNIDANDISMGWDGTYKNVVLPPGVYYYVVEATCDLGTEFIYKGDVTIVK